MKGGGYLHRQHEHAKSRQCTILGRGEGVPYPNERPLVSHILVGEPLFSVNHSAPQCFSVLHAINFFPLKLLMARSTLHVRYLFANSYEVSQNIRGDSYSWLFGMNTLLALLSLLAVENTGLNLKPRAQVKRAVVQSPKKSAILLGSFLGQPVSKEQNGFDPGPKCMVGLRHGE